MPFSIHRRHVHQTFAGTAEPAVCTDSCWSPLAAHTVHHILHTVPLRSPAAARLRRLQRLLSPEIRVSWKAEYHHRNQLQKQSTGSCPVTLVKQFVLCERQGHKCWKLIKVNAAVKSTILFCWLQGIKSQALCFVLKRWKLSAKDL